MKQVLEMLDYKLRSRNYVAPRADPFSKKKKENEERLACVLWLL
jgi:hypothetical protein